MWPSKLVHSSPAGGEVEDDCEGVFHAAAKMASFLFSLYSSVQIFFHF